MRCLLASLLLLLLAAVARTITAGDTVEEALNAGGASNETELEEGEGNNSTETESEPNVTELHYDVSRICASAASEPPRRRYGKCKQALYPPMFDAAVKLDGGTLRALIEVPVPVGAGVHEEHKVERFPCDMWTVDRDELADRESVMGVPGVPGPKRRGNAAGGQQGRRRGRNSKAGNQGGGGGGVGVRSPLLAYDGPIVAVRCSIKIRGSDDRPWDRPRLVLRNSRDRWPATLHHGQIDRLLQAFVRNMDDDDDDEL